METIKLIDSQEFRIKKINKFLLENEEKLLKGEHVLFNTKYVGDYCCLFEKAGYNIESIPMTSQLKISI